MFLKPDSADLRRRLREVLDTAVERRTECGLGLTVFRDGEPAIELYAGFADAARTRPVTPETLFPVYSVGKGFMAAAALRLVEKGIVGLDDPVARFWPEFGNRGKESIRLRDVLSHREALFNLPPECVPSQWADWDAMCRILAAAVPAWTPGTRCQYHPVTYAWLLGETLRRADGRPFDRIIREEVFAPAGIRDFHFGTDGRLDRELAEIDTAEFGGTVPWVASVIAEPAFRHGFVPSANGCGTASAVARLYRAILTGKLLKPETVRAATVLSRSPDDPVIGDDWQRFGLGFALRGPDGNPGESFGHGGACGAEGYACPARGLAVGFVKNHATPLHPRHAVRDEIARVLGMNPHLW